MSTSRGRIAILGIHLESNARYPWKALPRPVWPLDSNTQWTPPAAESL